MNLVEQEKAINPQCKVSFHLFWTELTVVQITVCSNYLHLWCVQIGYFPLVNWYLPVCCVQVLLLSVMW